MHTQTPKKEKTQRSRDLSPCVSFRANSKDIRAAEEAAASMGLTFSRLLRFGMLEAVRLAQNPEALTKQQLRALADS